MLPVRGVCGVNVTAREVRDFELVFIFIRSEISMRFRKIGQLVACSTTHIDVEMKKYKVCSASAVAPLCAIFHPLECLSYCRFELDQ